MELFRSHILICGGTGCTSSGSAQLLVGRTTADGSYTVLLRILDKNLVIMELKFIVASRNNAKWIVKNWGDKAAQIYGVLYESLMEN